MALFLHSSPRIDRLECGALRTDDDADDDAGDDADNHTAGAAWSIRNKKNRRTG